MSDPSTTHPLVLFERLRGETPAGTTPISVMLALGSSLAELGDRDTSRTGLLDALILATSAERAFLIEHDSDHNRYDAVAARNLDGEDVLNPGEKIVIPILDTCRERAEGFFTADLTVEPIFPQIERSRSARCRSLLVLPFPDPTRFIYVDHRYQSLEIDSERAMELAWLYTLVVAEESAHSWHDAHEQLLVELRDARKQARTSRPATPTDTSRPTERGEDPRGLTGDFREIVGAHADLVEVLEVIQKVAPTTAPILVHGESGTGKELIARAVHTNSDRRDQPFISENCAALAENLLEVELFGAMKGAYTGASEDRQGLFELANGGTLFLDEIGDTTPGLQKKLLRALQEKKIRRVGGQEAIAVDVRVVSATNRDLSAEVERGTFREDLYYRLNVIQVMLPPLRERRQDVPLLAERFIEDLNRESGSDKEATESLHSTLMAHSWPGNIRELQNEIRRVFALSDRYLLAETLSPRIRGEGTPSAGSDFDLDRVLGAGSLKSATEEWEREVLDAALRRFRGNKARVCEALQIPKTTLYSKLRRYGL